MSSAPPPTTEVDCSHCGLPVPAELYEPEAEQQFCCLGCRTVAEILAQQGLDQGYYRLRDANPGEATRATTTGRTYEELDAERFAELYVKGGSGGTCEVDLYLEGVHCGACVWLVERLPRLVPGVISARLDLGRSRVRVRWDPSQTHPSAIARGLDRLGYAPHPYRGLAMEEVRRQEDREFLIKIAIAGAIAGNVMLMAFALYGGMLSASGMSEGFAQLFRWGCLLLTVPAVLFPGRVFLRGAWNALRAGTLHMDQPIALGLLAGCGWGAVNTIRGTGEVYFDTVCVLIFLLLVGRWLERRQQRKAVDAAELLHSLQPSLAHLVEGEQVRDVPLEVLQRGDLVQVKSGEPFPADGEITQGESYLDLSLLTGESRPVSAGPGDGVHAGTVNQTAALRVRITETGEDTRVGRLMRQVEEQAQKKAPVVKLADRIAGGFIAAVLVLAVLTFAVWSWLEPSQAVDHAVALLIVTCPCALGLATPLAISVAMGRAAKEGILVKSGEALERLAQPGRVWLDKTGTLTQGRSELVLWEGDPGARGLALALEAGSAHPLAAAIRDRFAGETPAVLAGPARREGPGLVAELESGGTARIGAPDWVRAGCPEPAGAEPEWLAGFLAQALGQALTPILISAGDSILAGAAFGDPLRPESQATVARLRQAGWRVGILSGDHPEVVRAIGQQLGLAPGDCRGGQQPEDKLAAVERSLRDEGPTVMVGDGANDAAALSAATVGVGVHGGVEAALAAADVFLTEPDLGRVDHLFRRAARTLSVIRQNLVISLAYNLIGAGLAITGVINPLIAAVLMPFSSLSVIASSSRAGKRDL